MNRRRPRRKGGLPASQLGAATRALLALAAVASLTFLAINGALALFTDTFDNGSNTFNSDTLDSATSLSATGGSSITLNWTATTDTYASGHRIYRGTAAGGPYTPIIDVTPRTTTTYADSPANGTYYYVVRAFVQNWESSNSNEASATRTGTTNTGFMDCSANAADTGGDGNGFQTNAANACSNDAAFAQDTNSGTNTNTSCSNTGKDRHRYYDYNFSIAAGSTIDGIEVRLDAWADGTGGSPFMCVELSWDGGTTWTATKTTPTLTTTEASYTLGASTDTWGRTWSTGDLTNANFRVRIINVASNSNRDFRLDWVAVQVTYTPP